MKKSIIFILIVAVVTMIVYGVRYVKTPVTTESIYLTKYEETVKGNAFIVKKETVNTAPAGGTLYNYAVDGNRVGNQRRIASVYNGSVNTDILQELNNIDKKIELMTIEQSTQQIETSDSMSAESRISERKNGILNSIYSGDISAIATYKEEIKNIRFDAIPSSEVSAVIYNISEDDNGEKLLTVKCEKYLDGIFAIRYTTAEVVLKNYTGYKVPVYAIRVRDGQKGIEVQKGLGTIFKPCEVLYTDENEGFVIINSTENSENPIENSDLVYIGEK